MHQQSQQAGRTGGRGRKGLEIGADPLEVLPVGTLHAVSLLGDGKTHHLQGRGPEVAGHLLHASARLDGADDAGYDLLVEVPVGVQGNHDAQVVEWRIRPVDDLLVEGLADDDAAVTETLVEQVLLQHGGEGAEDIARAEVDPLGLGQGLRRHGVDVVLRQPVALGLPGAAVQKVLPVEFHGVYLASFRRIDLFGSILHGKGREVEASASKRKNPQGFRNFEQLMD